MTLRWEMLSRSSSFFFFSCLSIQQRAVRNEGLKLWEEAVVFSVLFQLSFPFSFSFRLLGVDNRPARLKVFEGMGRFEGMDRNFVMAFSRSTNAFSRSSNAFSRVSSSAFR